VSQAGFIPDIYTPAFKLHTSFTAELHVHHYVHDKPTVQLLHEKALNTAPRRTS
jgi:hypothetical protein